MAYEDDKAVEGCCGGAAPEGVDACCTVDAGRKAAGDSGCGCNDTAASKPKASEACC